MPPPPAADSVPPSQQGAQTNVTLTRLVVPFMAEARAANEIVALRTMQRCAARRRTSCASALTCLLWRSAACCRMRCTRQVVMPDAERPPTSRVATFVVRAPSNARRQQYSPPVGRQPLPAVTLARHHDKPPCHAPLMPKLLLSRRRGVISDGVTAA